MKPSPENKSRQTNEIRNAWDDISTKEKSQMSHQSIQI